MKLTLTDLQQLISDPEYRKLPIALTQTQSTQDADWNLVVSILVNAGVKCTIWECCAYVALLFDTYGSNVEHVELRISAEEPHVMMETIVNGNPCDNTNHLDEKLLKKVAQIDQNQTMDFVLDEIQKHGNSNLLSELNTLKKVLNLNIFTSAQQAREVAQNQAPEIEAWVRAWKLAQVAARNAGVAYTDQRAALRRL